MLPIPYLILISRNGSPYPEVTVVSLPSSLMIVSSNAFVYSTCLLAVDFRYGYFCHLFKKKTFYCFSRTFITLWLDKLIT